MKDQYDNHLRCKDPEDHAAARKFAKQFAEYARKGAKKINIGPMCNECAFKLNSPANNEDHSVLRAAHAVTSNLYGMDDCEFHCHPQGDYGDAGTVCKGFQYALAHFDKINK